MQTFVINCMHKKHTIIVNDKGQLIFKDHSIEELEAEIALMQLGTNKVSKCAKIYWQIKHLQSDIKINFTKEENDIEYFIQEKIELSKKRKFIKSVDTLPWRQMNRKIYQNIVKIINNLIFEESCYQFANNRWVDSENKIAIENTKTPPNIKQISWRIWSHNGKWSGNSTKIIVSVPFVHWYNHVYKKGLAIVDGFFVLDIIEETPNYYIVLAGKKGRGFSITPCKAKINKKNKSLKWLKQV